MNASGAIYLSTQTGVGVGAAGAEVCLFDVNVGTSAASAVLTLYDGTGTGGVVKAVIDASAKGTYHFSGLRFPAGLYADLTGGNAKVTVTYG